MLPQRKELLEGVLGADLIGFQTFEDERHFLNSVARLLGYESTPQGIAVGKGMSRIDLT